MTGELKAVKKIYSLSYRETTFGIRGGMITNPVKVETDDVSSLLETLKVALVGPSRKEEILIKIREEIQ